MERWAIVCDVTPAQLGLAGAAQLILLISTVTEKGQTKTGYLHLVTSRGAERLDATQVLLARRGHWGIETICHQRLDVSLHEDKSRVRSVSGVAVLGLLSRISVALFQADSQRPQPMRDKTYPVWSERLRHKPRRMLDRLLKPCLPP